MMKRTLLIATLGLATLGTGLHLSPSRKPAPLDSRPSAANPHESLLPREVSVAPEPASVEPHSTFTISAPTGVLDPRAIAAITKLAAGQAVVLTLPDGTTRRGIVHCVRHEEDGWVRSGGALADGGSFALSARDGAAAGLIQFPREGRAWQLRRAESGAFTFIERRLDDVLCLGLPRREREVQPVVEPDANAAVPLFDSRPTATAVLYLDFDGATITDPYWDNGNTIVAPRARLTPKQILKVCGHVAGDYASFDIDISTDAARYASTAIGHRMRAIITRNDAAAPGAGGVAYVDSFAHDPQDGFSADIPCWVFEDFAVDSCAEALSHELGHTLGLNHDGRDFPSGGHEEYYAGQGGGATGWAPIMGVSYYRRLSQWSKGEYKFANNQEDDVAIIAGAKNAFGFIPDEAGGTTGTAANLAVSGPIVNQPGVIKNAQDIDVFKFTTNDGKLSVRAKPGGPEGNIDLLLELLDGSGTVVKANNPKGGLAASLQRHLAAGTYYLRVSGTGKGDPLRTGYTNYGSIGAYRVVGKINGLPAAP